MYFINKNVLDFTKIAIAIVQIIFNKNISLLPGLPGLPGAPKVKDRTLRNYINNLALLFLFTFISYKIQSPWCLYASLSRLEKQRLCSTQKGTSRQRSGKGAIRKRFPLQKPRWEKTKLTIRYLYHETYRKPNEQLFSQ